jgi:transposase-like protein
MTFRFSSGFQRPSRRQWDEAISEFADHLSNDMPLNDIAARMDVSRGTVCVWLHQLCVRLGEIEPLVPPLRWHDARRQARSRGHSLEADH